MGEELNSFLAVAEDLKVKGLTQDNQTGGIRNQTSANHQQKPAVPKAKPAPAPSFIREPVAQPQRQPRPINIPTPNPPAANSYDDDYIQEVVPVKTEPREQPTVVPQVEPSAAYEQQTTALQAAETDQTMMNYQEEGYEDYEQYDEGAEGMVDNSQDVEELIAKLEDGSGFMCLLCSKIASAKNNMKKHIQT